MKSRHEVRQCFKNIQKIKTTEIEKCKKVTFATIPNFVQSHRIYCCVFFRANLALSQYPKAMDYANKCLNTIASTRGNNQYANRLSGYAYLCRGKANLGLSHYRKSLEDLEKAISVAHGQEEKSLECLTCCSMCTLYLQVKDYEKVNKTFETN